MGEPGDFAFLLGLAVSLSGTGASSDVLTTFRLAGANTCFTETKAHFTFSFNTVRALSYPVKHISLALLFTNSQITPIIHVNEYSL